MAKILKICNSEFLPPLSERLEDHVYFVYDKMAIYLGRIYYSDPFCIVEKMPEHPVEGMLYITIDGELKSYLDYKIITIGALGDPEEKKYLYDAGSVYFMKAEYRYLNTQTRTIELPFQNGSYQLSVNLAKNIVIDKNTVIRFNPKTNRFEIDGTRYGEEINKGELLEGLLGGETDTAVTTITGKNVKVDIKVSPAEGNLIQSTGDGLYASLTNYLTDDELDELQNSLNYYRSGLDGYLGELKAAVDKSDVSVSESSIIVRIQAELDNHYPQISKILSEYEEVYNKLQELRQDTKSYTDEKFLETRTAITKYMDDALRAMHPWDDYQSYLKVSSGTYKHYSYGGTFCRLYQASDVGAKFITDEPLMNEVYVVNKGTKASWVRIHLAVLEKLLPNPKDPGSEENLISIGATPASLAIGGWNWSTSINRESGKFYGPGGTLNGYKAKINEDDYFVYVITYETALGSNTKSLSAIRTLTLNTNDEFEVGRINALIQTDQWEFPVVVESVAKALSNDPYQAFNTLYGAVGTYNPFNMSEHVDPYDATEDGSTDVFIEYSQIANKPKINGVELVNGMSLEDIGYIALTPDEIVDLIFSGKTHTPKPNTEPDNTEGDASEYDYNNFSNLPTIEGIELKGNVSLATLGLRPMTTEELSTILSKVTPEEAINEISVEKDSIVALSGTEEDDSSIFNYRNTKNRPTINGVSLLGNKTLHDLGIRPLTVREILSIISKIS